jgi:hypothetical protein
MNAKTEDVAPCKQGKAIQAGRKSLCKDRSSRETPTGRPVELYDQAHSTRHPWDVESGVRIAIEFLYSGIIKDVRKSITINGGGQAA